MMAYGLWLLMFSAAVTRHLAQQPNPNDTSNAFVEQNVITRSSPYTNSSIYSYTEVGGNISLPLSWVEVEVNIVNQEAHNALLQFQLPSQPATKDNVSASFFVTQPVYISLTTMASRLNRVNTTILGLIQARIVPDRIYLLISKDAFLLDDGVTHIPDHLLCLVAAGYLTIVYTSNQGPHRKLLPVLKKYWSQDVFIATVDDDMSRAQAYVILYQLLKTHVRNNRSDSVVALRARRISICNTPPYRATRYFSWPVVSSYNVQEMLLMPTGTGGILYKPSYFHKAVFLQSFRYATGTADDLMFRLATLMNGIPVLLGCSVLYHRGQVVRSCKRDGVDARFDRKYGNASSVLYKELLAEELLLTRSAYLASKPTLLPTAPPTSLPVAAILPPVHSESTALDLLTTSTPLPPLPVDSKPVLLTRLSAEEKKAHYEDMLSSVLLPPVRKLTAEAEMTLSPYTPCVQFGQDSSPAITDATSILTAARQLSSKDLFSINRRGGNDHAWRLALIVLKTQQFSFENMTQLFIHEREEICFNATRTGRVERLCGLFDCTAKNAPVVVKH